MCFDFVKEKNGFVMVVVICSSVVETEPAKSVVVLAIAVCSFELMNLQQSIVLAIAVCSFELIAVNQSDFSVIGWFPKGRANILAAAY